MPFTAEELDHMASPRIAGRLHLLADDVHARLCDGVTRAADMFADRGHALVAVTLPRELETPTIARCGVMTARGNVEVTYGDDFAFTTRAEQAAQEAEQRAKWDEERRQRSMELHQQSIESAARQHREQVAARARDEQLCRDVVRNRQQINARLQAQLAAQMDIQGMRGMGTGTAWAGLGGMLSRAAFGGQQQEAMRGQQARTITQRSHTIAQETLDDGSQFVVCAKCETPHGPWASPHARKVAVRCCNG